MFKINQYYNHPVSALIVAPMGVVMNLLVGRGL